MACSCFFFSFFFCLFLDGYGFFLIFVDYHYCHYQFYDRRTLLPIHSIKNETKCRYTSILIITILYWLKRFFLVLFRFVVDKYKKRFTISSSTFLFVFCFRFSNNKVKYNRERERERKRIKKANKRNKLSLFKVEQKKNFFLCIENI